MLGIGRVSTSQLSEFLVHPHIFLWGTSTILFNTFRGLLSHDRFIRTDRVSGIGPGPFVLGHVFSASGAESQRVQFGKLTRHEKTQDELVS